MFAKIWKLALRNINRKKIIAILSVYKQDSANGTRKYDTLFLILNIKRGLQNIGMIIIFANKNLNNI
jgi:hypothetical protein